MRLTSTSDPSTDTVSITLLCEGAVLPSGSRLALTSVVQLTPTASSTARLVRRLATYHEFVQEPASDVADGGTWALSDLTTSHPPRHANDGPVSAFVILPDGTTIDVEVEPMLRLSERDAPPTAPVAPTTSNDEAIAPLVPHPTSIEVTDPGPTDHRTASLTGGSAPAEQAWGAVADLVHRLAGTATLGSDGGLAVEATIDRELAEEAYRLSIADGRVIASAAGGAGFRHAFVTLARWLPVGMPRCATVHDQPTYPWRGLHIDLARRWFEPELVEHLIDVAAWRKLSRLHLHLTDDEAWRLPVARFGELATDGGRRGHGLPLPPMLGDGAGPTGRAYTPAEIERWVERADELGVVLVPEADMPGHVHAALTALPWLRDPDDDSRATSVQFFVDNVLVPGHPRTGEFLTAVVDALAEHFPSSPWLHIGGDEVPDGAWRSSPIVAAYRDEGALATTRDAEASFHRDLISMIRHRTGRRVGAWQEAAESGGVQPSDGYVVGWRTTAASRELAARGFDVVVSPGQAYYLDMALDDAWAAPGASWAGATPLEDVCSFVPDHGWGDDERSHLLGIQACLWTEHVADREVMDHLLFPRLDAVAERAWTGAVVGGAESLRARAV